MTRTAASVPVPGPGAPRDGHGGRNGPTRGGAAPRSATALLLASVVLLGGAFVPAPVRAQGPSLAIDPAPWAVRYRDHVSWLRVNPLFVLPGERVTFQALPPRDERETGSAPSVVLRAPAGEVERLDRARWAWTAPDRPGEHRLTLAPAAGGRGVSFRAFVMVPMEEVEDGELDGYRIGRYPRRPFRGLARYRPPEGFVEVTPENRSVPVSPHFRLGDFLCKQPAGWPRYVVLQERLLWKLEALLALLNRRFGVESLHVMSGYRTPSYNQSIGQGRYSRHQYGDAADVYVDESPADGYMDDVNGDGRINRGDARAIYRTADRLVERGALDFLIGGLAHYPSTDTHGPFVHVDARGYRARW